MELSRDVPADPFVLAQALAPRGQVSMLVSGGAPTWQEDPQVTYVAAGPREVSHALVPPHIEVTGAGSGPRWIGVVPYEHVRELERRSWSSAETRPAPSLTRPTWLRYDAVLRIADGRVHVEADSDAAATELFDALLRGLRDLPPERSFSLTRVRGEDEGAEKAAHAARIRRALALIASGDIYQVNLARRLRYALTGDPLSAFASWMKRAPAPYGFFGTFDGVTVLGGSPELALAVMGARLFTCPIKGTRPRGEDAAADAALERQLSSSEKERAELTMAVDLHRNDLGRVAAFGSVRVMGEPVVVRGPRVMSRVACVTALRAEGVTLTDCVSACLPCGSVTGAPKIRAMEIIRELEPMRRGLYTGAYGMVGRDGSLVLAMAIRTATVRASGSEADREREVEYFSGGGIVCGSDPDAEVLETEWKALENLAPA